MRPSWKSLADFLFIGSLQAADLSYLVLFTFSSFLAALHSCHFSQITGIFCCWVESFLPAASTFLFFSSLVPCGTASLSMNVCSILSDPSLHDWAFEIQFFSSTIGILFGQCCASQRSPGFGIFWDPSPISPGFFLAYWLWPTGPSLFFLCVFLKPFPFKGLWILIFWTFLSSFSSSFFFSFFIIG